MATSIQKGDLILVTGVNGFIGSHVAQRLLQDGYRVRGTSRNPAKASWLYDLFNSTHGVDKFECVEVPDMVAEGAFDAAVKGCAGVIHVASVMTFADDPDQVVAPCVKGALNILTAASTEPGVKSVVYTSSSTAALMPEPNVKVVITEDTWNDEAVRDAYDEQRRNGYKVYAASKTEAERALWKAVEATKPPFRLATVLPNANFGPILKPGGEAESSTGTCLPRLWKGDETVWNMVPQWFVDVRDTAMLHVAALVDEECNGKRIFAFAEPYSWNDCLGIFRRMKPDGHFLEDRPEVGRDLSEIPNHGAVALLRKHYNRGFTGLEDSVKENVKTLI